MGEGRKRYREINGGRGDGLGGGGGGEKKAGKGEMWEDEWVGEGRAEGGWGEGGRGWMDREDTGKGEVVGMDEVGERECGKKQMWGRGMWLKRGDRDRFGEG